MKTIAIFNTKGGVGKTTSVVTLAHIFSTIYNKRTLVVDLDSQGNCSDYLLEVCELSEDEIIENIYKIMNNNQYVTRTEFEVTEVLSNHSFDPCKAIYETKYKNLSIIPSSIRQIECERNMRSATTLPQQFLLKNQLDKVSSSFDYCFLDCSPNADLININGLVASDGVLIPQKPEIWSLNGVKAVMNLIEEIQTYKPDLEIIGLFLTMYKQQQTAHQLMHETLSKIPEYLKCPIRSAAACEQATYTRTPLINTKRFIKGQKQEHKVAEDYLDLSDYILREV